MLKMMLRGDADSDYHEHDNLMIDDDDDEQYKRSLFWSSFHPCSIFQKTATLIFDKLMMMMMMICVDDADDAEEKDDD